MKASRFHLHFVVEVPSLVKNIVCVDLKLHPFDRHHFPRFR